MPDTPPAAKESLRTVVNDAALGAPKELILLKERPRIVVKDVPTSTTQSPSSKSSDTPRSDASPSSALSLAGSLSSGSNSSSKSTVEPSKASNVSVIALTPLLPSVRATGTVTLPRRSNPWPSAWPSPKTSTSTSERRSQDLTGNSQDSSHFGLLEGDTAFVRLTRPPKEHRTYMSCPSPAPRATCKPLAPTIFTCRRPKRDSSLTSTAGPRSNAGS
mmetsp:Transcript_10251/g.23121  ORF Transcript_10251/g.23121 Transcript_10251/m.23121 type:complete len:217 (-) Transcript_10251:846-1496(-)